MGSNIKPLADPEEMRKAMEQLKEDV